MFDRSSGILMPISSLPSKYGIGTLGKEAYNFIDFLHSSKQKYWQLLPLGPVSYGDSPYSSFSIYAGNPYYIDLEFLIEEGILSYEDCEALDSEDEHIDYEKQFNFRYEILYKAFINSKDKYKNKLNEFKTKNQWVIDYSLFMVLKYHFNQKPWHEWDREIKNRNDAALEKYKNILKEKIEFWIFLQYVFYDQYFKLKAYANNQGVFIIGDMPIYPAEDSVEVWADRTIFEVDEFMMPSLSAGVPPDYFSKDGQLWGNPVYNWDRFKENSFDWWIKRLHWAFLLYDVVRIDHFRGFDEFYVIPKNNSNAVNGRWLPAYGKELFEQATAKLGKLNIIAEDLGIITDSVTKLKNNFNFPGMKVLQFAFDNNPLNPYLPKNYEENSVAYTGTHDNDTLRGWFNKLDTATKQYVLECLNINAEEEGKIIDLIIESVLKSIATLAVIPLQDYLGLDSQGRMNTPSTLGENWRWRVKKKMLTDKLSIKIKAMTINSSRC